LAIEIVEAYAIFIWRVVPQIQVAICMVVAVRLVVSCAAEPPRRAISCVPSALGSIARVHRIFGASSTAVRGACDVNDPVRGAQLRG